MPKVRADQLLVERELAPTRARAQALVLAGRVYVGEQRVEKPGLKLAEDAALVVRGDDHPFVSRGGVKLAGALDAFAIDPGGFVAADFGASTGGFTDCLLQRGAARVYAIDVGYGQLADRLRGDPRVVVMERTNARGLRAGDLPEPMDLLVIDASFISLAKLLPAAYALLAPGGQALAMVKPQFEVGRAQLGKGGVVRDEGAREAAIDGIERAAVEEGFEPLGRIDAAIRGPKGNHEAFLWLRRPADEAVCRSAGTARA